MMSKLLRSRWIVWAVGILMGYVAAIALQNHLAMTLIHSVPAGYAGPLMIAEGADGKRVRCEGNVCVMEWPESGVMGGSVDMITDKWFTVVLVGGRGKIRGLGTRMVNGQTVIGWLVGEEADISKFLANDNKLLRKWADEHKVAWF